MKIFAPDFAVRFDVATEIIKPQVTDNGLVATISVCKDGILYYNRADGKVIREYRPREVNEQLVHTINNLGRPLPITDEHPSLMNGGMVNLDNISSLMKGVGNDAFLYEDSGGIGHVANKAWVYDSSLIKKILDKAQDKLSLGYKCKPVFDPDTYRGERYDFRQTLIDPNHEAVTSFPRGGDSLKFHLDSGRLDSNFDFNSIAIGVEEYHDSSKKYFLMQCDGKTKQKPMTIRTYSLGNTTLDIPPEFSCLTNRIDSLEKENISFINYIKLLEEEVTQLRGDNEILTQNVDVLKKADHRREGYFDSQEEHYTSIKEQLERAELKLDELGFVCDGDGDWVIHPDSIAEEDFMDEEEDEEEIPPKKKRSSKKRGDSGSIFYYLTEKNDSGEDVIYAVREDSSDGTSTHYIIDSVAQQIVEKNTSETIEALSDAVNMDSSFLSKLDSYPCSAIDVYRAVLKSQGADISDRTDSQIEDIYDFYKQRGGLHLDSETTPTRQLLNFSRLVNDNGKTDCCGDGSNRYFDRQEAWKTQPTISRK